MSLAGKELGKDVEQWLGPSTVAGAIKCVGVTIVAALMLTFLSDRWLQSFPDALLTISVAVDGQIFRILGIIFPHAISSPQAIDWEAFGHFA